MRVADLDPLFEAWLEARGYLNGLGPRTWRVGPWSWVPRFKLPTPGLTPAFKQHDLTYLLGGSEHDREMGDDELRLDMIHEADDRGGISGWLIQRAIPEIYDLCRELGATHFRSRYGGPRTEEELKRELRYFIPV